MKVGFSLKKPAFYIFWRFFQLKERCFAFYKIVGTVFAKWGEKSKKCNNKDLYERSSTLRSSQ